jgi:hypothetical protein
MDWDTMVGELKEDVALLVVDFGWCGGKFMVRPDMSLTKDRRQAGVFARTQAEALRNHMVRMGFEQVRIEVD